MAKKGSEQVVSRELAPICASRAVREERLARVRAHFPEDYERIVLAGHAAACTAALLRRIDAYRGRVEAAFRGLPRTAPELSDEYPFVIPVLDGDQELLVSVSSQARLIEERLALLLAAVDTLLLVRPNDVDPSVLRAWGRLQSTTLFFLAAIRSAGVRLAEVGPRRIADIAVCVGLDAHRVHFTNRLKRPCDELTETDDEIVERWRPRIKDVDIFPGHVVLTPETKQLDERFWRDPNVAPNAEQARTPPNLIQLWRPPAENLNPMDWKDPKQPAFAHFQRTKVEFPPQVLGKKTRGKPGT